MLLESQRSAAPLVQVFAQRSLADRDYVYCWADGIHLNLRLEDGRLCRLVLVGVRADGTKRLEAQPAGTWAVHAAKRSPRPAVVEITVTFQPAA